MRSRCGPQTTTRLRYARPHWPERRAGTVLVVSTILLDIKDTLNWLQGVRDEFVERPVGYYLGGISSIASLAGLAILILGAVQGI